MAGKRGTHLASPRERRTFEEMWHANKTYKQISETLQVPLGSVRVIALSLNLPMRERGRPPVRTMTGAEARKMGREKVRAYQNDFMHRQGLRRRGLEVVVITKPTRSLFGAPIRSLSKEDRRLVEEFIRAKKKSTKRRRSKKDVSSATDPSSVDND